MFVCYTPLAMRSAILTITFFVAFSEFYSIVLSQYSYTMGSNGATNHCIYFVPRIGDLLIRKDHV